MVKLFKKSGRKPGSAPGTITHLGKKTDVTKIQIVDFDKKELLEKEVKTIEESFPFFENPTITWVNIVGLHEVKSIEKIGMRLGIHPLVLEDIANTDQHPKVEDYDEFIFVALKMFEFKNSNSELEMEHISIVCGKNYILSFMESADDVFEPVCVRIREGRKTMRESKSDYLMYALLDAIVDNYFIVLENMGEKIEDLEKKIVQNPKQVYLNTLHKMQDEMLVIQKSLQPLRKFIPTLEHLKTPLISTSSAIFFRDLSDHIIQITDTIDATNNKLSTMNNLYLSVLNQKTNDAMKILALIATIFIPVTFLAGVYGMNFEFMPELSSPFGYPIVLGVMIGIGVSMIVYFKKKKLL
ncbi:MAG: magnesium and cobalt transport protein CorA [Crenarchaeota archaeon]|nr:MAG: magnesium and cobalt transport protein CorA [Thermoproteota archaeon]RDJ33955.1 MAG: magnesium and cobalt transport protein CorA [Thermoproteota archaeon]RDJ36930.1 MAG: magnesium and cobalt transport protein CorA [Thermoproteota archaeon]RDJ37535.1 MAG: magnesium and cobalt transport protein CorA [Thermoproteota archaeon]